MAAGKNLDVVVLLDFYGQLLTDKQREVLELYYDEDLSLAEIAQNTGSITRQGVRDSIKRGEAILFEMEEKLGLVARMERISARHSVSQSFQTILEHNERYCISTQVSQCAREIIECAAHLEE
ncbi:MAG: YlxM family DNA-binding protein [Oscillospiraceae bacterium]